MDPTSKIQHVASSSETTKNSPIVNRDHSSFDPCSAADLGLVIGDRVFSRHPDKLWWQAKVTSLDKSNVTIKYLLSGDTETIPISLWSKRLSKR